MRTRLLTLTAVLLAVGLLGGCESLDEREKSAAPQPADAASLDSLAVEGWASMTGYSRARFPHWDSQGDGCDTRDVVLQRDGVGVVRNADCRISAGSWISPYDGKSVADPQELDVDHTVPLANAWRTGASTWTDEKREEFANDLTRPQLIAVTRATNRAKGDQDPSEWRPPRQDYWCTYARNWVAVKSYWNLSVTAVEKAALAEMLGMCS